MAKVYVGERLTLLCVLASVAARKYVEACAANVMSGCGFPLPRDARELSLLDGVSSPSSQIRCTQEVTAPPLSRPPTCQGRHLLAPCFLVPARPGSRLATTCVLLRTVAIYAGNLPENITERDLTVCSTPYVWLCSYCAQLVNHCCDSYGRSLPLRLPRLPCRKLFTDLRPKHLLHAQDEFSRFGTLDNVWVARKPPGFAFIQFADGRDADDACQKLDGVLTDHLCDN